MTTSLATTEEAQLILKLYELRREPVMREARAWLTQGYWPGSAEEVLALLKDPQSRETQHFRQVTSYWEMACSFVLHGALSAELFVDCNTEPFFLYAKFLPMLPALRERMPDFLRKTATLIENSPVAIARVERHTQALAARRGAANPG